MHTAFVFADKYLEYLEYLADRAEQRGEQRGRTEGKLETLSRLLEQRFSPLSAINLEHLQKASAEDLDAMTLRVLSGKTVEEVLGKPKRRKK